MTRPARTTVYVDGFNLYYLALRGTPFRWLDLGTLADRVLGPRHQVAAVRYFSALILPSPADPSGPTRQQAYLRAITHDPRVSIHLGQFRRRTKRGPIEQPVAMAGRSATISTFEEKGSDVNLASWALVDVYEQRTEAVVLLTNDSDLAEPARLLRQRGTTVGLISPAAGRRSKALAADFVKTIRPGDLAGSQMPSVVRAADGREVGKPLRW